MNLEHKTWTFLSGFNFLEHIIIYANKTIRQIDFPNLEGRCKRFNNGKKSIPPKGTYKTPTKYTYLISASSLNLEGVMRETNSKNKKTWPKNHFLGAVMGWYGAEKLRSPKGTSRTPTKYTYLISVS